MFTSGPAAGPESFRVVKQPVVLMLVCHPRVGVGKIHQDRPLGGAYCLYGGIGELAGHAGVQFPGDGQLAYLTSVLHRHPQVVDIHVLTAFRNEKT